MDVHACMVCNQLLRRNYSIRSSLVRICEDFKAAATSSPPIQIGFASPVCDGRSLIFCVSDLCSQKSPAASTCSKTPATKPETQKTPATNNSRPIPMKFQTDSYIFRPTMTGSGYHCYCYFEKTIDKWVDLWICIYPSNVFYCYFEKTIDKWVDLWICLYPSNVFYYVFRQNLEKWLDPWILTSLLIIGVLYALDGLLRIQTRPFKLLMLLRKLSEMVKILIRNMICNCVARYCDCIGRCCLFGIHVIAGNTMVSPVIAPDFISEYHHQCI